MTATLEAPTATMTETPAQSLTDIASDMLTPIETAVMWVKSKNLPIMYFDGRWIVQAETAIAFIQYSSREIADRCLQIRGLVPMMPAIKPEGKAAAKPATKAMKPTAKKPAAKKAAAKTTAKAKTKPEPAAV
jgi:hypothetical protein